MTLFRYEAITHAGDTVKNTLEAGSKAQLILQLRQMGYWPTQIVEETEEDKGGLAHLLRLGRGKVKSADVEVFYVPTCDTRRCTRLAAEGVRGNPEAN